MNIVSIEDNEVFLFILKQTFAKRPTFNYSYFKNIEIFFESNNVNPDFILLDHQFENANSLSVISEISEKYPKTKIIILSAKKDEKIIAGYLAHEKVIDYLCKSDYNVEKLGNYIDKNLI